MKGDANVIDVLNAVLPADLTATNQYIIPSTMCRNLGFHPIAPMVHHDAIHA